MKEGLTSPGQRQAFQKRILGRELFPVLYTGSPWLTVTGILMLGDIVLSVTGLIIDPSSVTGAPTWLKPLKFAISTCLFCFTVAFMVNYLKRSRRVAGIASGVLATALVIEIVMIDMQAARHTNSHFNFATRFDGEVFTTMGFTIAVVFLSTMVLFIAACLERPRDHANILPSILWATRLGLVFALLGMGVGALMTLPTPEQLAALHSGHRINRVGGHTVGAPDGGVSIPITGWSADHGDLRVAHFVGLHAMQVLLIGCWVTGKYGRWTPRQQVRYVMLIAFGIFLVFITVLWQALRAQSFLRPDSLTLGAWIATIAVTVVSLSWAVGMNQRAANSQH